MPHAMPLAPPFRLFVLTAALLAAAAPVAAQDGGRGEEPVLPDLAPQEVEIRGQLEISFPSLQRQPLVGFNPPPPVPDIPAGRRPFVETYKQASADLPASPLGRPDPPAISALAGRQPIGGLVQAAAGRYFSRQVDLYAGGTPAPAWQVSGALSYDGLDGYEPFDARPDVDTPRDRLDLGARAEHRRSRFAFGLDLDGYTRQYALYGVAGDGTVADNPERTGQHGEATLSMRTITTLPVEGSARLSFSGTRFETDLFAADTRIDPQTERTEQRVRLDADLLAGAGRGLLTADVHLAAAGLDAGGVAGSDVTLADAGAGFRFQHRRIGTLEVGGRLMAYRAETERGDRDALYAAPDVRLDLHPFRTVQAYVQNRPEAREHPLGALYEHNPWLVDEPRQQPTVVPVNVEAGARVFAGPVQLAARAGYLRAPDYRYFVDAPAASRTFPIDGLFEARYDRVWIASLGGDASIVLPQGLHATLGVTVRDGRLREADVDIPYFAALTAHGMVSYAFLQNRGLAQLTAVFEGERSGPGGLPRVDPYLDLDLAASYALTEHLGVVLGLRNLAGEQTRWPGYPEPPFVVLGGMRLIW